MKKICCTPCELFALAKCCFMQHNCGFILPDDESVDSCTLKVLTTSAEMVDGDFSAESFPRFQIIYNVPHAPNVEARLTLDLQYIDSWFFTVSAWADGVQLVDMFFTVSSQIDRFNISLIDEPEKGGKVKNYGN